MVRNAIRIAAALALISAAPAFAQQKTPAQLTQATSIANGDLLLVWPSASNGPLKSVQWSVAESLMQAALGNQYLQVNNNLSDVASPSISRANLGLGGAAVLNVGQVTGTVMAGDDSRVLGAAQLSGATFTGSVVAPSLGVDPNFFMELSGGSPIINFLSNAFISYNRTSFAWNFNDGGVNVASIGASGFSGNLTGNVTGNLTGTVNVSGNVVGTSTSSGYTIAANPVSSITSGGFIQLFGSASSNEVLIGANNASPLVVSASGVAIGGNPAAFIGAAATGVGSISYGTSAPGTLAVNQIYLQTN